MDHLAATLKKGGIKDLQSFFPANRRSDAILDAHFRGAGLPQVADWWTRKQHALIKEDIGKAVKDSLEREDQAPDVRRFSFPSLFSFGSDVKQVVAAVRAVVEERPLPESELVASLWHGLMAQVDWSARPDQIEGLALREVSVRCPPKPATPHRQTNHNRLMNYAALRADHRAVLYRTQDGGRPYQHGADVLLRGHADHEGVPADLEGPSQLIVASRKTPERRHSLQVLYNKDCVSDQAIIYWHQKGSKPQGRQHFLKATEGLVKVTSYCVPP